VKSNRFQSAPHFSSEANARLSIKSRGCWEFQSAPHFSSEANAFERTPFANITEFQSAPHFSSEANTGCAAYSLRPLSRFNPRLTSAARRTTNFYPFDAEYIVSIRASLQQRGEHAIIVGLRLSYSVSIRASLQQRGERISSQDFAANYRFQSAPHFSSEANTGGDRRRRNG